MDSQRSFFLILFAMSLFMLWLQWTDYQQKKYPPTTAGARSATSTLSPSSQSAPLSSQNDGVKIPAFDQAPPASTESFEQAPDALANQVAKAPTHTLDDDLVEVNTDVFRLWLSPQGASIVKVILKQHLAEDGKGPLVLMDAKGDFRYSARSGLLAQSGNVPNHLHRYRFEDARYTLSDGQDRLVIVAQAEGLTNGLSVQKIITMTRGQYLINTTYRIDNPSDQPLDISPYYLLTHNDRSPEGSGFSYQTYTGPVYYTAEQKYNKVDWSDIDEQPQQYRFTSNNGWIAIVQHYFVSSWVLPKGENREFFMQAENQPNLYSAGLVGSAVKVPVQGRVEINADLYAGPQNQDELEKIAEGLDLVVDYGLLTIIAKPLFVLMQWIHKLVGNWGWTIVLLTLIVKTLFFPLSAASYKSMARMRKLTPKMQQLREMYANDKQKQQQELIRLYKIEKVNPLGGCLPILIQIPVFLALYWVLLGSVEMRNAPWILWIHDLAKPDPYYVLPIVMAISMFIQTKLNPSPPDPMQARIMMMMPIVFSVMFFFFPAGLVLYWVVNNTLSIIQQQYNNKKYGEPVKKKSS